MLDDGFGPAVLTLDGVNEETVFDHLGRHNKNRGLAAAILDDLGFRIDRQAVNFRTADVLTY